MNSPFTIEKLISFCLDCSSEIEFIFSSWGTSEALLERLFSSGLSERIPQSLLSCCEFNKKQNSNLIMLGKNWVVLGGSARIFSCSGPADEAFPAPFNSMQSIKQVCVPWEGKKCRYGSFSKNLQTALGTYRNLGLGLGICAGKGNAVGVFFCSSQTLHTFYKIEQPPEVTGKDKLCKRQLVHVEQG